MTSFDGDHYRVYYSADEDEEELSEYEFDDLEIVNNDSKATRVVLQAAKRSPREDNDNFFSIDSSDDESYSIVDSSKKQGREPICKPDFAPSNHTQITASAGPQPTATTTTIPEKRHLGTDALHTIKVKRPKYAIGTSFLKVSQNSQLSFSAAKNCLIV